MVCLVFSLGALCVGFLIMEHKLPWLSFATAARYFSPMRSPLLFPFPLIKPLYSFHNTSYCSVRVFNRTAFCICMCEMHTEKVQTWICSSVSFTNQTCTHPWTRNNIASIGSCCMPSQSSVPSSPEVTTVLTCVVPFRYGCAT